MSEHVYSHASARGARTPGWEDVNMQSLADALGMAGQHLRQALTGRTNCTVRVLNLVASELGINLEKLIERIQTAKALDTQRAKNRQGHRLRTRMAAKLVRQNQQHQ